MHRGLWLPLLAAALIGCGPSAAATDAPLAQTVADQLQKKLPGFSVTIVDPLTLKVGKPSQAPGDRLQVNLDRINDYCSRTPAGCADTVSEFVTRTAAFLKETNQAPTAAKLRAVVRPAGYVTQLNTRLSPGGDHLISAPFAGDLVMLCYVDTPAAMRPALQSDLATFGLTREQALETCQKNTLAGLPPLPTAPPRSEQPGTGALGYLNGDAYESSYLLLHGDWAALAKALDGHLLVAAPDADVVLYGADAGAVSVDALAALAAKVYGQAKRPISQMVFRWTPTGWEVANH